MLKHKVLIFATIEPNIGIVNVPDKRLEILESIVNPENVIPATIEILDIAGLVKGRKWRGFRKSIFI